MRYESYIVKGFTLALVGVLLWWASGCSGATGGDGDSVETSSEPLLSATTDAEVGEEPAALALNYTPVDGWGLETGSSSTAGEMPTRRQAQNGNGNNGAGVGGDGSSSTGGTARFSGESPATVRFFGGGGQASRFRGTAPAQARFDGGSQASSRFDGGSGVTSAGGICDPVALCDYVEAVCEAYPAATGSELTDSCAPSAIQQCRTDIRRAVARSEGEFGSGFVCFFSVIARCAAQGIEAAGSVSSQEELSRAALRGLETCSIGGEELEFGTGDDDDDNGGGGQMMGSSQ